MNLAITVLVAIAVASIIGTVLQQNQDYNNYIIKFGPFWHDAFESIGLYDVYSVWWFMLLLGFLLLSTSVCVYRNGPTMLRDMKQFRLNAARNSLKAFHHNRVWQLETQPDKAIKLVTAELEDEGFKVRRKQHDDHVLLASMKGGINRLGYLFTHIAIVVICVGALVDSNVPLRMAMMSDEIKLETRNIPASQVPEQSVLGYDNPAFRGAVSISEGESANIVFLNIRDGYLVQKLPFSVELKDFRIEHYPTGQPKSFESDLLIHDEALDEPLQQTIAVNYPLIYKGYRIFQASFSDGGSNLVLKAWPLKDNQLQTLDLKGKVLGKIPLNVGDDVLTIELDEFRKFNINPVTDKDGKIKQKNFGPSFTYKLRDQSGQAREFVNYMSPIQQEGRWYFMSGIRESVADPFRYLYIPADANISIQRFMNFRVLLLDAKRIQKSAELTVKDLLADVKQAESKVRDGMVTTANRLVTMYAAGGMAAVTKFIDTNIPEDQREVAAQAYFNMLRTVLGNLYVEVLEAEGIDLNKGVSEADSVFFDDAISVMGNLEAYETPFYLQLKDYEHIEASGLQITRAPGKDTVYLGCVMLILGIFMMFYIQHRRCWAWIGKTDKGVEIIFAGSSNRNEHDFAEEFNRISERVAARLEMNKQD
ncbi:MAG: cytochrome c biogenesis protein ResB [Gammaproteobacteria bacterium]|nr:cytochrome c biogenesis protein ResB [Gammaproteobacteria bacterium]